MVVFISTLILIIVNFTGCSWADKIDEGTYICKTPYIEFFFDSSWKGPLPTAQIEIDRKVYKAFFTTGYDATITYYEFQEEEINPTNGWYAEDNEIYANFNYKFDSNKKQLILTDKETGNVYHLDKVE